jgi:hypothetical protein
MKLKKIGGLVVAVGGSVGVANAAVPAAASAAFTALQTDALDMIDLAWPVIGAVTVGFILLRIFKRASSSAV